MFYVRLRPGTKIASDTAWQFRPLPESGTDPASRGVHLGASCLIVIDEDAAEALVRWAEVDPRAAELLALCRQTLTVRTRKGRHFYFRAPANRALRSRVKYAPGVDLLAGHRYVVAPGATADGWEYATEALAPVLDPPGWLLDLLDAGATTGPGRAPTLLEQLSGPKPEASARAQWDRLHGDVVTEVRRSVHTGSWNRDALLKLSWELAQLSPDTAHRDWSAWFSEAGAAVDARDVALIETGLARGTPDEVWRGPAAMVALPDGETAGPQEQPTGFWQARPELARIHEFARSRRAAPLAVLGSVLVDVVAVVEPTVTLPAIVGSRASLNLFLALVGQPGSGKDIAQDVAREAVTIAGALPGVESGWSDRINLGSGQGMAHAFMRAQGKGETAPTQVRTRAVLSAGEIDTLASHAAMKGATLLSELRKLWMGQSFGHHYADHTRRVPVPAHAYRACLVAGVQPARSGVLLDDAGGGTPQRFVWLPAEDPRAPDVAPVEPPPWQWTPPICPVGMAAELEVCDVARREIDAGRLLRLRGIGDGLDAHALLARLKVAAALGVLAGRLSVTDEDWALAGELMAVSRSMRETCAAALAETARSANTAKAKAEVERGEYVADAATQRVARWVLARLSRQPVARSELRRGLPGRDRGEFDPAIEMLARGGQIVVTVSGASTLYALP